jgi:hypothetical protein
MKKAASKNRKPALIDRITGLGSKSRVRFRTYGSTPATRPKILPSREPVR